MDNHSMTWESRFYLKGYCTASRPQAYRNRHREEQNNVPFQ